MVLYTSASMFVICIIYVIRYARDIQIEEIVYVEEGIALVWKSL